MSSSSTLIEEAVSQSLCTPVRRSDLVCSARSWPRRGSPLTSFAAPYESIDCMRTYTIVVEPEEDGGFLVSVPALPGCFTQGATIEDCRERAAEAIAVHIAGLEADGEPVPEEVGAPQLLSVTVAA
jgi:antitoxin HicB